MNFGIAFLSDRVGASDEDRKVHRASAFAAALDTYKFVLQHFWALLRLALLPIIAAGLVLYVTLSRYLSELLLFLDVPNPRVASLALGMLAAGLFLSLFCYAIAVSAICDLAVGKPPRRAWLHCKAERQEWRVYAAYLRLLLLISAVFVFAFLLSTYVAPLLIPVSFNAWVLTLVSVMGVAWLFARIGFLIAPVVAVSHGPVLRRATQESARDLWRNCLLIVLLLVPGVLVLIVGGYAFRMGALRGGLPLADSARSMKEMLVVFVSVTSLSALVTMVLLTIGAIAVYQPKRLWNVRQGRVKHLEFGSNSPATVPAEGPPK